MQHGLTAAELAGTMHPYPTAAAWSGEMASGSEIPMSTGPKTQRVEVPLLEKTIMKNK